MQKISLRRPLRNERPIGHVYMQIIGSRLIYSRALDLNFPREELKQVYPEFREVSCKFQNCEHDGVIDSACNSLNIEM